MKNQKGKTKSTADAAPERAIDAKSLEACYGRICDILSSARATAARSVNTAQVVSYWLIGREIVEEEQRGSKRATYGRQLLLELSKRMVAEYGRGFGPSNLKDIRRLYLTYPDLLPPRQIGHTASGQSAAEQTDPGLPEFAPVDLRSPARPRVLNPNLSWSHYRTLLSVGDPRARDFYELEAARQPEPTPLREQVPDAAANGEAVAGADRESAAGDEGGR